jgi:hypothetical protein
MLADDVVTSIDMARLVDEVNLEVTREVAEITRAVLAPERWPEYLAQAERDMREYHRLGPAAYVELMRQRHSVKSGNVVKPVVKRAGARQAGALMTRSSHVTWDQLPLFAADEAIGEAVLGRERKREFSAMAQLHERYGMPKISPVWGGRYVPAVKQFLDSQHGLPAAVPFAANGVEGDFHGR